MALFAEWTPSVPWGRVVPMDNLVFCLRGRPTTMELGDSKDQLHIRTWGGLTETMAEEFLAQLVAGRVARHDHPDAPNLPRQFYLYWSSQVQRIVEDVLSQGDKGPCTGNREAGLQTSVNPQDASQQEASQLQVKVQDLEEKLKALTARDVARQAEVCELRDQVGTLQKALEDATQREASQLKAQINRFEEGQEALRASINAQTAAMIAQQAWVRAHAPGVERISAPGPSDINSWTLVGLSQDGAQGTVSGISVDSGGPRCFLMDAVFKTPLGLCEASDLHQGSNVLAENCRLLKVVSEPEQHTVNVSIELQAAGARLQITPDHRIVIPNLSTVARWKF